MNPGHPPCCKVPLLKSIFEESPCCISCSKLGTDWGEKHRVPIMLVAALFSLFGVILSLFCLLAVSTDAETIKKVSWNYGESDQVEYFVGLNILVVEAGGQTAKEEWDDVNCAVSVSSDACDACAEAATGIIFTVAMAFVTSITTLQTDIQRSTRAGDLNCQKFMGMFTAVAGFFGTLFSLSSFVNDCSRELPDENAAEQSIDWSMGPGFGCLLVATIIKPIDFFAHYIVPVVKPEDDDDEKLKAGAL